jgi:hypothetical protein
MKNNKCDKQIIREAATRINNRKIQLSRGWPGKVLYSDVIKNMGMEELLTEDRLEMWKRILAECINIELEEKFMRLQEDLAEEESPLSQIIIDAKCITKHE